MKILVTGGAGFIGHKISQNLIQQNHCVSIVDFEHKIKSLNTANVEAFSIDISKPELLKQLPTDYDLIIHCAAQTGGYYSLLHPQIDCSWNALGTLNIVQYAKLCKSLRKIIYTSSMAVYGEGKNKTENCELLPISNYGVSKLAGENYIKLALHHNDTPFTILRLWNTYGAGQDLNNRFQGMLSIYLAQALESNTIKITGSKNRIRDFIHVNDVVSAINLCIDSTATNNEIYNVCYGKEYTSEDVIGEISKQLNKNLSIQEIDGYTGDQQFSTGSNLKLKKLNWAPQTDLASGIKEFIQNL